MTDLGTIKPLSEIQEGNLILGSQEIADALLEESIDETDCGFTGLFQITDASGWKTTELWATNSGQPSDPAAGYTLIRANGTTAPVTDWPGFEKLGAS